MKILKDNPKFKILTPKSELKKQLLNIERAGRTCYQSDKKKITQKSAKKFIKMILNRHHESVIEHSSMSVQFSNVSRGFTHELVRHRLAAYSQESTRYVDYASKDSNVDLEKFQVHVVVPPHKDETEKFKLEDGRNISAREMIQEIENFYRTLRKNGWLPEEARQLLPIGLRAQIVITANFREWRHIFSMRTSQPAHWEIRGVMCRLLKEIKAILSPVFDDFKYAGKDRNGVPYFEKKSPK